MKVSKHTIPWAETPESAVTRDATTRLVDATVPAMTAALHEAFDREIARARRPRATFTNTEEPTR